MIAEWMFILGGAAWMASLEVQVEGGNGWSANTETWRLHNPLRKIIGWPYITGYHLSAWMMTLFMFHIPFLFEHRLTWPNWLQMMELWWGFWMVEDFWWFAINPLWGVKKFLTQEIPWHPKKFLWLPRDYWVGGLVWVGLEITRQLLSH